MITEVITPVLTIDDVTHKLLKNFAAITNQIILHPGNAQRTMLPSRGVLARANFPVDWPKETAIYNLNGFLNVLSLFKTPEVQLTEEKMILTQAGSSTKVHFQYSDPTTVLAVPDKQLPTENPSVSFTLSADTVAQMRKTASILSLNCVTMKVSGPDVVLFAKDSANKTSHGWEYSVPSSDLTVHEEISRSVAFKVEHFSLLAEGAYTVTLEKSWRYAYLIHQSLPVSYFIAEML